VVRWLFPQNNAYYQQPILPPADAATVAREAVGAPVVSPHGFSFRPTPLVRGEPPRRSSSSPSHSDSASSPAPADRVLEPSAGSGFVAVDAEFAGGSLVLNEIRRAGLRGSHVVGPWTRTFPNFNLRSIWPKGG
jgi:hypothetical protein